MGTITPIMVKELRGITGAPMMNCKKALEEAAGDYEKAQEILRKKGEVLANKKSSRDVKEGCIRIFLNADQSQAGLIKLACETDFVARNERFLELAAKLAEHKTDSQSDDFTESQLGGETVKETLNKYITELGENIVINDSLAWKSENSSSRLGQYTHFNNEIAVLVEIDFGGGNADHDLIKDIAMHIAAMPSVHAIDESGIDPAYLAKEEAFFIEQAKESGKPQEIIEKMVQGRLSKIKKEICLLNQPFVKDDSIIIKDLLKQKSSSHQITIKRFYRSSIK